MVIIQGETVGERRKREGNSFGGTVTRTGGQATAAATDFSDAAIIARDRARNEARDAELQEVRNRDTNMRQPEGSVQLNVVEKDQAFATAAAAGGVPPETMLQTAQRVQLELREQAAKRAGTPQGGWQNVIDVLGIAINPFSRDKISANVDNQIVKWGLELAANNPFTTALVATGIVSLARSAISPLTSRLATAKGEAARRSLQETVRKIWYPELYRVSTAKTVGKVVTNTVTRKLTGNLLAKAGFTVGAAATIITIGGTYPFARFELVEALDKIGYARGEAVRQGKFELVDALNQLQDEILNPTAWEQVLNAIPFVNVWKAVGKNLEAAESSRVVFDKIISDKIANPEEPEDEKWARIREEEQTADKAAVDYYNSERKKLVTWELEAKAEAQAAQSWTGAGTNRAEQIKRRNEDAAFWAAQAESQRELEAEDRKAIADFWNAYRKRSQQLADNNRPSNLNFGLL